MDQNQTRPPSFNPYDLILRNEPRFSLFKEILDHLAMSGVSPALVWVQLCAIASFLTQGLSDVLWPNGRRATVGANGLLIGLSGCGKSAVYSVLMAPVEEFLLEGEPPTHLDLLIEDATIPSVIAHLKIAPYAGIFSDEAGALIHLQGAGPMLAKLLDGTPLRRSRAMTEPLQLVGHRLTMLQMMQPRLFDTSRLFSTAAGGAGLINRFMVGTAAPLTGSLDNLVLPDRLALQHRSRSHALLFATIKNAKMRPAALPVIRLDSDATRLFDDLSNEARLYATAADSPLALHGEYVSRHAERTLRLAAAIHLYDRGVEGLDADVSPSTLRLADELGRCSIAAYQQLAHRPTQPEKDAETIHQALRANGIHVVKVSDLLRYGVNLGLTRRRVGMALPAIVTAGMGQVVTYGKTDFLELFPFRMSKPPFMA